MKAVLETWSPCSVDSSLSLPGAKDSRGVHPARVVVMDRITLRARATLRATGFVGGSGGVPVEQPPPSGRSWLGLAQMNQNVADVLRMVASDDIDWVALYKVVEVIKDDVGGKAFILREGWATETQWKAFGIAANHPAASGDSARHARMPGSPKQAMTLAEGRHFVHGFVPAWLSWRTQNP